MIKSKYPIIKGDIDYERMEHISDGYIPSVEHIVAVLERFDYSTQLTMLTELMGRSLVSGSKSFVGLLSVSRLVGTTLPSLALSLAEHNPKLKEKLNAYQSESNGSFIYRGKQGSSAAAPDDANSGNGTEQVRSGRDEGTSNDS